MRKRIESKREISVDGFLFGKEPRYRALMQPTDKVRAIMKLEGWTQTKVAAKLGVSQSTVNRWVNVGSEPEGDKRDAIDALYTDLFQGDTRPKVLLKGYIGAGQAIYPLDDGGDDLVDAPPNASPSTVAVRIRGESMLPVFEDGWILYYSRQLPAEEMINKRAVAKLADGRMLVKTIRRGSESGLWTLTSTNAGDIEDVALEWAAPIDWIKPQL